MAAAAREVLFVLQPEVVLLDLAGPADAFRNADQQQPGSYRLRFVAAQRQLAAAGGSPWPTSSRCRRGWARRRSWCCTGWRVRRSPPPSPARAR